MRLNLLKIIVFGLLISFLIPLFGNAQVEIKPPLKWTSWEDLINAIIDFIFNVALVLAPLMIIVGAFYFVTAAGDPGKVQTAKNIIFWTIIGLIVILLAKGLVTDIRNIFGVPTPTP